MQVKCEGVSNNTNNNLHQFDSDSVSIYLTISSGTKLQEMKEKFFKMQARSLYKIQSTGLNDH